MSHRVSSQNCLLFLSDTDNGFGKKLKLSVSQITEPYMLTITL